MSFVLNSDSVNGTLPGVNVTGILYDSKEHWVGHTETKQLGNVGAGATLPLTFTFTPPSGYRRFEPLIGCNSASEPPQLSACGTWDYNKWTDILNPDGTRTLSVELRSDPNNKPLSGVTVTALLFNNSHKWVGTTEAAQGGNVAPGAALPLTFTFSPPLKYFRSELSISCSKP